jgi:hypothetical protein
MEIKRKKELLARAGNNLFFSVHRKRFVVILASIVDDS